MRVMAGGALLDKGLLRGQAVSAVAVGADVLAGAVGIAVTAGAQCICLGPQPGIGCGEAQMRGIRVVAGAAVKITALVGPHAMPVLGPIGIDAGGDRIVHDARLDGIVATDAVDGTARLPHRLGLRNAGWAAVALVAHARIAQVGPALVVLEVDVAITVPAIMQALDRGMAVIAADADVTLEMAGVSAAVRRIAMTGAAIAGVRAETGGAGVGMTLRALLMLVVCTRGLLGRLELRGRVANAANRILRGIEVLTVKAHRPALDQGADEIRIATGLAVRIMASGACQLSVCAQGGMAARARHLRTCHRLVRLVAGHATVRLRAVAAVGIEGRAELGVGLAYFTAA